MNMKSLTLGGLMTLVISSSSIADWNNNIEAGYSKSSGNSDTESIYVAAASTYSAGLFGAQANLKLDQQKTGSQTTKDYRLVEGKLKRFFKSDKTIYGYGNAQWEQDDPAGLQSNWVATIGPGYQWSWPNKITLAVELGAGYQSTDYKDNTKDYDGGVGRFFGTYTHPLNQTVKLKADTLFLADEQRTRNTSNLAVESSLTESLSLSAGYEYRYNSDPEDGKKKEDTTLRLTAKYAF